MKKSMKQSTLIMVLNGLSILFLIFMAVAFSGFNVINKKVDRANNERFELTYNANRFMNGSAYLTNEVRGYAATGNKEHYDNYWNEINTLKNRDIGVQRMKEIGITSDEQSMIDEMSSLSNTLVPLEEQAMKNVDAGKKQEAIDYVYGSEYSTSIARINQLKSQFLERLDARALGEVNRLLGITEVMKGLFILCLLLVAAMQGVTVLITRKRIIAPIIAIRDEMGEIAEGNLSSNFQLEPDTSEIGMLVFSIIEAKRELKNYIGDISEKLTQMAGGNMNQSVDSQYRGEFLSMSNSLTVILDSLNRVLHQFDQAAEEIAASSRQVAEGSQALSDGGITQTDAISSLQSTINKITDQLSITARDATEARSCSMEASSQIVRGNQKMEELTRAMEDISGASSQISGIIKTIEDIAFQTNILALNAAVEAARAGQAGKGFAVVADEVRNLASKSSEAAKGTTELIENTLSIVKKGTDLAGETAEALNQVVDVAKRSTDIVDRIAQVSGRQSESLKQVRSSIEQISHVVQNNAATAEESANSSEVLSQQAATLSDSVRQFKLRP